MFNITFLALVDANYNSMCVNTEKQGSLSDGGIFKSTLLYRNLEESLPYPELLPDVEQNIPRVTVADDAFALHMNVLRAYPGTHPEGSQHIFNYTLSQARRVAGIFF
jgi:hypothetical protein